MLIEGSRDKEALRPQKTQIHSQKIRDQMIKELINKTGKRQAERKTQYSLDLGSVKKVDKCLQTVHIPNCNLTNILRQVKVAERAQSNEGSSRITSLQILD